MFVNDLCTLECLVNLSCVRHQALTLLTFTRLSQYLGASVIYSLAWSFTNIQSFPDNCVRQPEQTKYFLSTKRLTQMLSQNMSNIIFLILGIFTKVSYSSPVQSAGAKDKRWMFDFEFSAQSRSLKQVIIQA